MYFPSQFIVGQWESFFKKYVVHKDVFRKLHVVYQPDKQPCQ